MNLPLGAFVRGGELRTGVAIGDRIVDLRALHDTALLEGDAALGLRVGSSRRYAERANGARRPPS